jgi:hypothetical protein
LLDAQGALDPRRDDLAPLDLELREGWLRRLVAADPASGS